MIDNGYRNFGEGFDKYIKSIENLPRISAEDEEELSAIIQNSLDDKEISDAIEKLVVSNLLLVVKFAINYYKFINKGEFEISIMDLISEGNLALAKSAETFDFDKGRFSTYASHYIKRYLQNSRHNNRFIRLPINYFTIVNMSKKIKGDKDKLSNVDLETIAEAQGSTVDHVKFVLECYRKKVLSIDQPTNFDSSYNGDNTANSFMDTYPSDEKSLDEIISDKEDKAYLLEKIGTLSKTEQKVIYAKYFNEKDTTCQDLATVLNVSKQRISQILIGALKKLKKKITEDKLLGKDGQTTENNC